MWGSYLYPCISYLTGTVNVPKITCCQGLSIVSNLAETVDNRGKLCICFKDVAGRVGVRSERAKALASQCDIQTQLPLDPTHDCHQ